MVVKEIYLLLDLLDDSPLPLKDLSEEILHVRIRRRIIPAGKHRRRPKPSRDRSSERDLVARIRISKFWG